MSTASGGTPCSKALMPAVSTADMFAAAEATNSKDARNFAHPEASNVTYSIFFNNEKLEI
jgi:hypothetical protein